MDLETKIKELKDAGYASKEAKDEVKKLFEESNDEQKEAYRKDYDQVMSLSEESNTQKEVREAVGSLVKSEVEKAKEELHKYLEETKEAREKKAGIYHNEVQNQRKQANDVFKAYLKAIGTMDDSKVKELTTDQTGSPYGGYTVDSELDAEIRHIQTEYGVARREMSNQTLSKNSYKTNELVTDAVVYWVDEASSISSNQVVLGQNELNLKKMGVIVSFTNELLEDSEIDWINFMGSRVAELFSEKEDEAFFNGDGTSSYGGFTGLLNSSNVNTVTMDTGDTSFADINASYLNDMVDSTPAGALSNAKFYMHRSQMSNIRTLKDSNGQFIFQRPADSGPNTVWGYPVVLVEVMPSSGDDAVDTPFVIFGDLKKGALLGTKRGIQVERSSDATIRNVADDADINLFTEDRQAIRWTQRVGYIQTITNNKIPVTVLKTAAT